MAYHFKHIYTGTFVDTTFTVTGVITDYGTNDATVELRDFNGDNKAEIIGNEATDPPSSEFIDVYKQDAKVGDYSENMYLGHTGNGVVVNYGGGNALLFTDTVYVEDQEISFTAEDFPFCFLKGTRIETPAGPVGVESLKIGDLVLNAQGQAVPVKWIGRQTRHPLLAAIREHQPVRVAAGALGDGVPLRDLFVTADHALLVDGCMVHASALVNGRTIVRVSEWQGDLEYFHVETEHHEIILAEGAPAETFIDNVSRAKFDNHAEYARLYPDAQPMEELALPRVKFERQLPQAIRRRLDAVAQALAAREALAA